MSTKVRIEWITLSPEGVGGGPTVDQPGTQYGVQELATTGGAGVATSGAPYFGLLNGVHIINGVARVTVITGAAIVAAGASPAPTETSGYRVYAGGPPLDIPVQSGWQVAIIEAADPQPAAGAVDDLLAETSLASIDTAEGAAKTDLDSLVVGQGSGNTLLTAIQTAIGSSNTALGGVNTALALLETHADAVTSNSTLSAIQTALSLVATHADETTANTALAAIQTALGLLATHTDAGATNTALATINTSLGSLATHGDLVTTNADLVGIKGDLDAAATAAGQATAHTDLTGIKSDLDTISTTESGAKTDLDAISTAEAAAKLDEDKVAAALAGSVGVDYSANQPALPVVGAGTFGGATVMAAWVKLATIPANTGRTGVRIMASGGQRIAVIEDDGTAAGAAARVNATIDFLDGGSTTFSQGGANAYGGSKGRIEIYGPAGALVSARSF